MIGKGVREISQDLFSSKAKHVLGENKESVG
jgi:hypothetical protein